MDGRRGGRDALALARLLAGTDTRFVLAHVWTWDPLVPSDRSQEALAMLARERDAAGIEAGIDAVGERRTLKGLAALIADHHPDVLVLGTSHRKGVERLLLGDVGRAAIHDLDIPVALAPPLPAPDLLRVVGVGWDDSDAAHAALGEARALAAGIGARVQVLTVVEPTAVAAMSPLSPLLVAELQHDTVRRARERVDALGDLPGAVGYGSAGDELQRLAGRVDLLVLGARHGRGLRRRILGSAVDHVLHGLPCAALVVPLRAGRATADGDRDEARARA
jgi:nucleotide-binding universal stress UspA family protein